MPLLSEAAVRVRSQRETTRSDEPAPTRLAGELGSESDHFDIFLSHSIDDAELVNGVRLMLEDQHLVVYVDRPFASRQAGNRMTPGTMGRLRRRMIKSESLILLLSGTADDLEWIPWILGYFDGKGGRVASLPLSTDKDGKPKTQGYVNLYPYVDIVGPTMWANGVAGGRASLVPWLLHQEEIRKPSEFDFGGFAKCT
jgi:hypothetical protein